MQLGASRSWSRRHFEFPPEGPPKVRPGGTASPLVPPTRNRHLPPGRRHRRTRLARYKARGISARTNIAFLQKNPTPPSPPTAPGKRPCTPELTIQADYTLGHKREASSMERVPRSLRYPRIGPVSAPPFDPPPRANDPSPRPTTTLRVLTAPDRTTPGGNLAKLNWIPLHPVSGRMEPAGSFTHCHQKSFFEKYFPARENLHVDFVRRSVRWVHEGEGKTRARRQARETRAIGSLLLANFSRC